MAASQQYAIWEVGELGVVLAFRGTASYEDALVDVAITPVPLQLANGAFRVAAACADDMMQLHSLPLLLGSHSQLLTDDQAVCPHVRISES